MFNHLLTIPQKEYEILCFPDLGIGSATIFCDSEEAAIASYRRTYPHAQKVFATEVEQA